MKSWGFTLSMSGNVVWVGWENIVRLSFGFVDFSLYRFFFFVGGFIMLVFDVKMTILYKGVSCWNKVLMFGRFLNF